MIIRIGFVALGALGACMPAVAAPCSLAGPVLFASQRKPYAEGSAAGMPLPTVTVYDSGGWSLTETRGQREGRGADRVETRHATGCLSAPELATIRRDLSGPWTISEPHSPCDGFGATVVAISVRGKLVWTEEMCGPVDLGDASRKQLNEITAILAAAVGGTP